MEDKELYNPQNGEVIKAKRSKQFWKDWRFYVYTLIAIMLAIVSFSSCLTACAAINAGVGQKEDASYSVAQRKNAAITTDEGGYSGFRFSLDNGFPSNQNTANCEIYTIDLTSYTLTLSNSYQVSVSSLGENLGAVNALYSNAIPSSSNRINFIAYWSYTNIWGSTSYRNSFFFSFVRPSGYGIELPSNNLYPFILTTDHTNFMPLSLSSGQWVYGRINNPYMLVNDKSDLFYINNVDINHVNNTSDWVFQDVVSYYQERGYQGGYEEGYTDGESVGYSSGHSAGYNEGYASGNANGYASGYEQATQDYQTGVAFTSYGLYANAQLTLTTDEVIGNYSYMYLFKYVTSNYDEHTVYVLFTQNSSTSQYLGYVLDRNDSDDSTSAVTLGSFSAQSSLAVTITAEQDQYFELYTGFVTSFYDRGSEVIEAIWFSGGTSQTALQNYQDGYDTGYQDGVSAGYGSGYDAGYRVGEVAGINQAEPEALTNTLVAVFQQPFNQIYRFFNFNILGLNVLGLATGLLSVFIIIKVFKKVLK